MEEKVMELAMEKVVGCIKFLTTCSPKLTAPASAATGRVAVAATATSTESGRWRGARGRACAGVCSDFGTQFVFRV